MFVENSERSRMARCMNGPALYASIHIKIGQFKFQQPNYITLLTLLHKERSICFAMNKIELISKEKRVTVLERGSLQKALNEDEANELKDLAPSSFSVVRKAAKNTKKMNINEIISYLRSQYSTDIRRKTFRAKETRLLLKKYLKD